MAVEIGRQCRQDVQRHLHDGSHEARYRQELRYNGQEVPYDAMPTFLGLTFDRTLSFNAHAKKVRAKMEKLPSMLSALRGTTSGCRKKLMQSSQVVRSVATMAELYEWQLQRSQRRSHSMTANKRAARVITGCTRTTPSEMFLDAANLLPAEHKRDILCCIAHEKALPGRQHEKCGGQSPATTTPPFAGRQRAHSAAQARPVPASEHRGYTAVAPLETATQHHPARRAQAGGQTSRH